MRNSLRLAVVGAALGALSIASAANAATTATATATAEVLSTLSVSADSALDFGQIAANTGGTVTVNADSTVSKTGDLVSTGTRAPATFSVVGSKGAMVAVTLPTGPATLTRALGTETMELSGWNSNPNGAFQLDATTGAATFSVGGTLTVASAQVAGVYSGTFDVSVEYQ